MSTNKLTIVPVKLDPLSTESSSFPSSRMTAAPACIVKMGVAEVTFYHGVNEHIIQTVMKELKSR
ncbi:hypothetical protein MHB44_16000 [Lysinibacillus sp. FSL H8-0500]|uniref:Uncharacterized protein n=1 Tax=Lysinibacillus macroides TaxID=33935 RepID=A0A0N0CWN6_9BACI|nr:hypothetical protein [Lysinibacillus macroides]KOY81518.1 hypothetical protein ADM90_13980 [Lysinibacillus macroides]KOY83405.1 hypothetical protein ADM90_09080 [Lysinibacillus macroides]QPR69276.1 hypothetical protein I6G82_06600 [Lysinibacillus macroides]QPR69644.1 hypothetical protein I6G82_08710 [Lysinibacillus macroides]